MRKYSPTLLLLLFCILEYIIPVISIIVSSTITTYSMIVSLAIVYIIVLISTRNQNFFMQVIIGFFPIITLEILYRFLYSSQTLIIFIYDLMYQIAICLITVYVLKIKRAYIYNLSKITFVAIIITIITTIIGIYLHPMASRYLATVSDVLDKTFVTLQWQNVGGYSFVYTVILLYPMLICSYKQNRLKMWQMAVLFVAIAWLLIKTEYATALLMFLVSSILLFLKKQLTTKSLIIVLVVLLVILIFLIPVLGDSFQFLSRKIDSQVLSERFAYISDILKGVDTTSAVGNRTERWMRSLNTFIENPIIGCAFTSNGITGGHSYIMDRMALYGSLGIAALVIFYRMIYKIFYREYRDKPYWGYILFSFLQTILLSTINTGNWIFVIGFGIPIFVFWIDNDKTFSLKRT